MDDSEREAIQAFREWFGENGGSLNPHISFRQGEEGTSVYTKTDLQSETALISCPFTLAITLQTVKDPLLLLCQLPSTTTLSERQQICTYISLHWIISNSENLLKHRPYLNILPGFSTLRTPLYFSENEVNLFKGTNLYVATLNQQRIWHAEWHDVRAQISTSRPDISQKYTWPMYLAAATYLTSRAFPSTLLSATPSLQASASSYPILLPGIDMLNHARGQPVTWGISRSAINIPAQVSSQTDSLELHVTLTLNAPASADSELFNNYGLKPNSSFILGYGFALENNPDDTIILKIGSRTASDQDQEPAMLAKTEFEIGRDSRGADALWEAVRCALTIADDDDNSTTCTGNLDADPERAYNDTDVEAQRKIQLDMQTVDALMSMLADVRNRLPRFCDVDDKTRLSHFQDDIRPEVRTMWIRYVQGQWDIMESLFAWIEEKDRNTSQLAEELGIDIVFDDADNESGE